MISLLDDVFRRFENIGQLVGIAKKCNLNLIYLKKLLR